MLDLEIFFLWRTFCFIMEFLVLCVPRKFLCFYNGLKYKSYLELLIRNLDMML